MSELTPDEIKTIHHVIDDWLMNIDNIVDSSGEGSDLWADDEERTALINHIKNCISIGDKLNLPDYAKEIMNKSLSNVEELR